MSEKNLTSKYHLSIGQYLGEISALCFLRLPYLLAGTGSQLLLYEIGDSAKLVESFRVFEGIRVHGITCGVMDSGEGVLSTTRSFELAVFGEKRVKLFNLSIDIDIVREECLAVGLHLVASLPRFSHWVMDVSFLKSYSASPSEEGRNSVAIGCSDNSVRVWDVSRSCLILEVQSPERCLLYSMRLWGDNLEDLLIASGTIFNEIIVWKVIPRIGTQLSTNPLKDDSYLSSSCIGIVSICGQQYEAVHIGRLIGHEGSIFRIVWSLDGSKLVSVSDDRSARIWAVNAERKCSGCQEEVAAETVLFGHSARVWDCCISSSLVVTAGEDCTCRLWGFDGKQLKMIKEHIGRGVWRCQYDSDSSLLITAGFDSAIKVHQLSALPQSLVEKYEPELLSEGTEIFSCQIPNSSKHIGLMDSKSEYVRCLHLKSEDSLYVATNNGYLYHAKFFGSHDVSWTKLVQVRGAGPIICMDMMSKDLPRHSNILDDWIAFGDGTGKMTITRVIGDVCTPEVDFVFNWSAEKERQLLGAYWCKALGHGFIFTSDPRGNVKLWQLFHRVPSVSSTYAKTVDASLVAEFSSSLGFRIMCLDASFKDEVLVCGDLRGNIVIFPLLKSKLLETTTTSHIKIPSASYFKGAHGISTISSVSIAKLSSNEVEICSTGGDGCICYLEFDRDWQGLEFVGMKQVKELSLIQSVASNYNSPYDLSSCGYAVGFASTDFIIWNLMTESKVVQVPCGGWRRPHTYYFGETNHCFAFVKEESIYIYQQRLADRGRKLCPQNLHVQFHGREMHSLCFVLGNTLIEGNGRHYLSEKSCWIATGCEDGTVRLTSYSPGVESWMASKLLGEHVGGSAVRSICFVSKMHLIAPDVTKLSDWRNRENIEMEDRDNPVLLISVGAKRVLTTWLLRNQRPNEQERSKDGNEHSCSLGLSSSMTFKWLSSDMPVKHSIAQRKTKSSQEKGQLLENAASMGINMDSRPYLLEKGKMESEAGLDYKSEDDWRHLAVTAFLLKCIGSSLTVCFVAVASSDATVALRALILPHRLWFDVASLVPLATPVLALQHIVIPNHMLSGVKNDMGNLYVVISGATDGSIAFWDLTESIEAFVKQLLTLDVERLGNHNQRPRTGRGSQGGRFWRSLRGRTSKKKPVDGSIGLKTRDGTICCSVDPAMDGVPPVTNYDHCTTVSEAINDHLPIPEPKSADSSPEISEIQPLHVLRNVHQSGVNCLHVSDIEDQKCSKYTPIFSLVSGGDDQALHCLKFCLSLSTTVSDSKTETPESAHLITKYQSHVDVVHCGESWIKKCSITFLYHDTITSAHTSAVKGVWTDGTWVFSTGLDQRVRCWLIDEHCKLSEQAHTIISVPEPEALDASVCGRNCYQIAVAGRGMQIVEFSAA